MKDKQLSIVFFVAVLSALISACPPTAAPKKTVKIKPVSPLIKTIDGTGDVGKHASIDLSNDSIFVSYYDATNGNLKFALSENNGLTWTIKTVDSAGDVGLMSSIAVAGGSVYIAYYDLTNTALKLAVSRDMGETWDPSDIVTIDAADTVGINPYISINDGFIAISYFDETAGGLKLAYSTDDCSTCTVADVYSGPPAKGLFNSVFYYKSNLYMSMSDQLSVYLGIFTVSEDGTVDIDTDNIEIINDSRDSPYYTGLYRSGETLVGVSSNMFEPYQIRFYRSDDLGDSWDFDYSRLIGNNTDDASSIHINGYGGRIYVSYYEDNSNDMRIISSNDLGSTWKSSVKVEDTTHDVGSFNGIAVRGPNVFAVYYDATDKSLKFARSGDYGVTWK